MTSEYVSPADTAKLVRKALAMAFSVDYPTVRFSVRTRVYSGGASIDVSWTDGPTTPQVEKVAKRYEGASFDGSIDLKSYVKHTVGGREVHYGADFIFCQREYSVEHLSAAAERIAREYGVAAPAIKPPASKRSGAWVVEVWTDRIDNGEPVARIVMREAQETPAKKARQA